MVKMFLNNFKTVFTTHDIDTAIEHIRQYNAAMAISTAVAANVFQRIQFQPAVIHNGIASNNFKLRNNYRLLPNEKIRLVQLSRLVHEKKGQDILIEALN